MLTVASEGVVSAIITDLRIIRKPNCVVVVGKTNEQRTENRGDRAESKKQRPKIKIAKSRESAERRGRRQNAEHREKRAERMNPSSYTLFSRSSLVSG
jgi:hypothetical protein